MKHIQKTIAPFTYLKWCCTQRNLGVNYNFKSLPTNIKQILHKKLGEEQGFICGYSMKRIYISNSHLEHLYPQTLCALGQDLRYHNLIACFPKPVSGGSKCPFGAEQKGPWWDALLFISPLNDSCELKFVFNLKGEISASGNNITASNKTIEKLKLDDPSLTNDRKLAIDDFIFGSGGLSVSDVKTAIDSIYQVDASGEFYEYCIAIHDALFEYWDLLKKIP